MHWQTRKQKNPMLLFILTLNIPENASSSFDIPLVHTLFHQQLLLWPLFERPPSDMMYPLIWCTLWCAAFPCSFPIPAHAMVVSALGKQAGGCINWNPCSDFFLSIPHNPASFPAFVGSYLNAGPDHKTSPGQMIPAPLWSQVGSSLVWRFVYRHAKSRLGLMWMSSTRHSVWQ